MCGMEDCCLNWEKDKKPKNTNFAKNWKRRHFTVSGHRIFKHSSKITFSLKPSEINILLLKLTLEIGTLVLFLSAFNLSSFVVKIFRSKKSLAIFFTNKKFRVWTSYFFWKTKRKFSKTLDEGYFLLSCHRNVAFLRDQNEVSKNLVWLNFSKWCKNSNNSNV